MLRTVLYALLLWVGAPAAGAQTFPASELTSADLQALVMRSRSAAGRYAHHLRQASHLASLGDYIGATESLQRAAEASSPDSRWFIQFAQVQQAAGDSIAAGETLVRGLAIYPHSSALQLQLARRRGDATEASDASKLSPMVRHSLAAERAFGRGAYARALHEVELTFYASPDYELPADLRIAAGHALAGLLDSTGGAGWRASEGDTSFLNAYADGLHFAARMLRAALREGTAEPELALARLKLGAWRTFVQRGLLARWPDPLLVDLHVLDRAGHLEIMTIASTYGTDSEQLAEYRRRYPERWRQARALAEERWEGAVAEFVGAAAANE